MQTTPYYKLEQGDIFKVPYPYPIVNDDTERCIENLMKAMINDKENFDFGGKILRLVNNKTERKINRTFLVPNVTLPKKVANHLLRLDEHGKLHMVGTVTRLGIGKYQYELWETPQLYQKRAADITIKKPRQVERVTIAKTVNLMHPGKRPVESQVRLTFAPTNNYERNLTKAHLLAYATAMKSTPASKVHIKRHGFDDTYQGSVLRSITEHDGSFIIHYFKCIIGKHHHFDVVLSKDTTLRNWAPKKHLPILKAYVDSQ